MLFYGFITVSIDILLCFYYTQFIVLDAFYEVSGPGLHLNKLKSVMLLVFFIGVTSLGDVFIFSCDDGGGISEQ